MVIKEPIKVVNERFAKLRSIHTEKPEYREEMRKIRKRLGERNPTFYENFSKVLISEKLPQKVLEILQRPNLTNEQRIVLIKDLILGHQYVRSVFELRNRTPDEKEIVFKRLFILISRILREQGKINVSPLTGKPYYVSANVQPVNKGQLIIRQRAQEQLKRQEAQLKLRQEQQRLAEQERIAKQQAERENERQRIAQEIKDREIARAKALELNRIADAKAKALEQERLAAAERLRLEAERLAQHRIQKGVKTEANKLLERIISSFEKQNKWPLYYSEKDLESTINSASKNESNLKGTIDEFIELVNKAMTEHFKTNPKNKHIQESLLFELKRTINEGLRTGDLDQDAIKMFIINITNFGSEYGSYDDLVRSVQKLDYKRERQLNDLFKLERDKFRTKYTSIAKDQEGGGFVHYNIKSGSNHRFYIIPNLSGPNPERILFAFDKALEKSGLGNKLYFKVGEDITRNDPIVIFLTPDISQEELKIFFNEFIKICGKENLYSGELPTLNKFTSGIYDALDPDYVSYLSTSCGGDKLSYNSTIASMLDLAIETVIMKYPQLYWVAKTRKPEFNELVMNYFRQYLILSGIDPNTLTHRKIRLTEKTTLNSPDFIGSLRESLSKEVLNRPVEVVSKRKIIRKVEELPAIPKDHLRLIHVTSNELAEQIVLNGFNFANQGIIDATTRAFSNNDEVLFYLKNGHYNGFSFKGQAVVIMDISNADHRLLRSLSKDNPLKISSDSIVAILPNAPVNEETLPDALKRKKQPEQRREGPTRMSDKEKLLSEVEPIGQQEGIGIKTKADLKKVVEEPLLPACELFYDLNIETVTSSANKNHKAGTFVYLGINYRNLSDENLEIAKKLGAVFVKEGHGEGKAIFQLTIKGNETVEEISNWFLKIAKQFKKQELKFGYHHETLNEIITRLNEDIKKLRAKENNDLKQMYIEQLNSERYGSIKDPTIDQLVETYLEDELGIKKTIVEPKDVIESMEKQGFVYDKDTGRFYYSEELFKKAKESESINKEVKETKQAINEDELLINLRKEVLKKHGELGKIILENVIAKYLLEGLDKVKSALEIDLQIAKSMFEAAKKIGNRISDKQVIDFLEKKVLIYPEMNENNQEEYTISDFKLTVGKQTVFLQNLDNKSSENLGFAFEKGKQYVLFRDSILEFEQGKFSLTNPFVRPKIKLYKARFDSKDNKINAVIVKDASGKLLVYSLPEENTLIDEKEE